MQAQFLCLSASLPRACNFQAFPHPLRSVVPYGPGLHFHVSTVLIRQGEIALTPEWSMVMIDQYLLQRFIFQINVCSVGQFSSFRGPRAIKETIKSSLVWSGILKRINTDWPWILSSFICIPLLCYSHLIGRFYGSGIGFRGCCPFLAAVQSPVGGCQMGQGIG